MTSVAPDSCHTSETSLLTSHQLADTKLLTNSCSKWAKSFMRLEAKDPFDKAKEYLKCDDFTGRNYIIS